MNPNDLETDKIRIEDMLLKDGIKIPQKEIEEQLWNM